MWYQFDPTQLAIDVLPKIIFQVNLSFPRPPIQPKLLAPHTAPPQTRASVHLPARPPRRRRDRPMRVRVRVRGRLAVPRQRPFRRVLTQSGAFRGRGLEVEGLLAFTLTLTLAGAVTGAIAVFCERPFGRVGAETGSFGGRGLEWGCGAVEGGVLLALGLMLLVS